MAELDMHNCYEDHTLQFSFKATAIGLYDK